MPVKLSLIRIASLIWLMKRVLLVYPPFCTPATPPYSITSLYSKLRQGSANSVEVLDLNLSFHKELFPEYQKYYHGPAMHYEAKTLEFRQTLAKIYSQSNRQVVNGSNPILFEKLLALVKSRKPDIVAFSLVYSSQVFYAYALIKALNCTCIVGGPAVSERLASIADSFMEEEEFLKFVGARLTKKTPLDFSVYNLKEYFTQKPVLPIKTSSTCYYKGCAFCSHYSNRPYEEFPFEPIKATIESSGQHYFFIIDDMIPLNRLLMLGQMMKSFKAVWTCQLKPTKEYTLKILQELRDSGLVSIMWGVESGVNRILQLMNKGTNAQDVSRVMKNSHKVGICNIAYVMFGFPTETRQEMAATIDFIEALKEQIDLVSTSVFGLHANTPVFRHPERYGIRRLIAESRTILDPKFTYEVESGLSAAEAAKFSRRYKKRILRINKYPTTMNFFREHLLTRLG